MEHVVRGRDESIDVLKFIAAVLITNSHLDVFEPRYALGTGCAIGDVLFLFCSGYTLFMGRMAGFANWYKRRLLRIFPSVICWGILAAFLLGEHTGIDRLIVSGGGWFVQCILIYYVLAYPVRRYLSARLGAVFASTEAIYCIWFSFA